MQRYEDLKNNLFPASHAAIDDWFGFPLHRDSSNEIDTHKKHSSQAMAIDIFGTIKCSVDRDLVLDAIAETAGLPPGGPWRVELEWIDEENLLGEPHQTQVDAIAIGSDAAVTLEGVDAILMAVPTQHVRGVMTAMRSHVPKCVPVISLAKGLEHDTSLRPSQILHAVLAGDNEILVLSGPSHAEEVARSLPTAVVLAGKGDVVEIPHVGGLHHHYQRQVA